MRRNPTRKSDKAFQRHNLCKFLLLVAANFPAEVCANSTAEACAPFSWKPFHTHGYPRTIIHT
ncbi:hypothetical protein AHAS_Ahas09G0132900 [Arachis hypogaea]